MEAETVSRSRVPALAAFLSLVAPGLGHVYTGQAVKGIALLFAGICLGPLGLFALVPASGGFHAVAAGAGFAFLVLWVYAAADAIRAARRAPPDYIPRDYNHPAVYVLLALLSVPVAAGWASYVRECIVEAFRVPSASMAPSIRPGDLVLANKRAFRVEAVRRGDVVIFPHPDQRHQSQIKRVVALAGDTVEIRGGRLLIDGKAVESASEGAFDGGADALRGEVFREENGDCSYPVLVGEPGGDGDASPPDFPPMVVPCGHCFVLGDNRVRSLDSRSYGPIPLRDLVGRVDRIYFPRWKSLRE